LIPISDGLVSRWRDGKFFFPIQRNQFRPYLPSPAGDVRIEARAGAIASKIIGPTKVQPTEAFPAAWAVLFFDSMSFPYNEAIAEEFNFF
jgi:hypothetical protein